MALRCGRTLTLYALHALAGLCAGASAWLCGIATLRCVTLLGARHALASARCCRPGLHMLLMACRLPTLHAGLLCLVMTLRCTATGGSVAGNAGHASAFAGGAMRRILSVSVWGLLARDGVLVPGAARSRLCSVGLACLGTLPPAYPRMGNMIVCRTGAAAVCALHGLSMLFGCGLLSGGRHLAVLLVRHAVAHKRSRRVVLAIEFAFAL